MKKSLITTLISASIQLTMFGQAPSVHALSKNWKLDKYKVFWYTESPSDMEAKDYMHLKSDMSFSSISEGQYEEGHWQLDTEKKQIVLSNSKEDGELVFVIEELESDKLIVYILDSTDDEAEYLKIHFKAQ